MIPRSLSGLSALNGSVLKKLLCAAKWILIVRGLNRQDRQEGRQRGVEQVTVYHHNKTRKISAEGCRVC